MPSLALVETSPPDIAVEIGQRLCGAEIESAEIITGGGNNGLYKITAGPDSYALKLYRRDPRDPRDRLKTEVAAVEFLTGEGVSCIPRLVAHDASDGAALFEWIDGVPIQTPERSDITRATAFIARLKDLSRSDRASHLPLASEACFSVTDTITQIRARRERLDEVINYGLKDYLLDEFDPATDEICDGILNLLERAAISAKQPLPASGWTLSPSDFGFHNALRRPNGEVVFLDFEYFGWDDPTKLVSDTLLHPGMDLDDGAKRSITETCTNIFRETPKFRQKLQFVLPLYGLRWCLILLNIYLQDGAQISSTGENEVIEHRRQAQLLKSRNMLATALKLYRTLGR